LRAAALPLSFPADYELAFDVRGEALPNALEMKLVDCERRQRLVVAPRGFRISTRVANGAREENARSRFAWGPAQDRTLAKSAAIEFVIARGHGGGRGSVCLDNLRLREREAAIPAPASVATALSPIEGTHPSSR
jgi:hypothetical protein